MSRGNEARARAGGDHGGVQRGDPVDAASRDSGRERNERKSSMALSAELIPVGHADFKHFFAERKIEDGSSVLGWLGELELKEAGWSRRRLTTCLG